MAKTLVHLTINDQSTLYTDDYLQHLYHPFKIVCQQTDTYNDLFAALQEKWKDHADSLAAINTWIELQRKMEDPAQHEQPIITGWDDAPSGEYYAWFDIQDA